MRCQRCGSNPPDFLWQGDDHPVMLPDSTFIVNMDPPDPTKDYVRVTASMKVGLEWCSFIYPRLETQEVDGQERVVIHLVDGAHKPFIAYCSGRQCIFPPKNDKRPLTLCEACGLKALRG